MPKILIIDDERSIRRTLKEILEFEDHTVDVVEDGISGIREAKENNYDVIFCDIKMPQMDGMEVLTKLKNDGLETPIIMISGHGNIETAVESIKNGAYDFIEKPLDLNRILVTIKNALDRKDLVEETKVLKKQIKKHSKNYNIIGQSAPLQDIRDMIGKVGPSDARVLITGPNGAGKELVARQLHEQSSRSKEPFIEVNCAAIPSELIESELFGHEKGAFTSAVKQKKGKFELASKGTLFLDEIGDMSVSAQAKVLRALQENCITRVGGEKDIKVNPRVVAATNKDLRKMIEDGDFREDLYHRLSVIVIKVPSLNERKDDIPILTEFFLEKVCGEYGMATKTISDAAIKALQDIDWTGNIRELRNVVERLIILGGDEISEDDVKSFVSTK
ncbi:MAG: sigma-54-dependent transcriptional regulator [Crocinitomicaceae bacterium]